ncbi:DUF4911 domain-containing protein [Desulfosporosinus sp. FKA]|uniref:DUF4911 domain-containing protein n=1 Tax=Desulfosporosinus sp. FKA TaxID=1969834 RepID=UPI000B497BE2|nr:DUF4911 domain-containing protein [Desulfosporosinus sp. FKA]
MTNECIRAAVGSPLSSQFNNTDLIVKARLDRSEIQMLCKLVEGLGHLGIVTTTNKEIGEVMIQTTIFCWPELKTAIEKMPMVIDYI